MVVCVWVCCYLDDCVLMFGCSFNCFVWVVVCFGVWIDLGFVTGCLAAGWVCFGVLDTVDCLL